MTVTTTVRICPIYKVPPMPGGMEVWASCPSMQMTQKPTGTPAATQFGCSSSGGEPNPNCVSEVREIDPVTNQGLLKTLFPVFTKIPRNTAQCPLIYRGDIEELHSSERLFLANDTDETHLIRLYLLIVTVPHSEQFYWPVGFEVTGYQPGLQLPVVRQSGGDCPEYSIEFSNMTFDVLVERNPTRA